MKEKTRLVVNRLFSVLSGVIAGILVISLFESISMNMHPFPDGLDSTNRTDFISYINTLPSSAFILVLSGHALGGLLGGFVTSKMAKIQKLGAAIYTGLILLAATVLNLLGFPHPIWFSVIDIILPVTMAWLGFKIQAQLFNSKA